MSIFTVNLALSTLVFWIAARLYLLPNASFEAHNLRGRPHHACAQFRTAVDSIVLFHNQSNTHRTRAALSAFKLACLIVRRTLDQLLPRALPPLVLPIAPPLPLLNAL